MNRKLKMSVAQTALLLVAFATPVHAADKPIKAFILAGQSKMVILRDIKKHPQNVHYNTVGQLVVGKLFAEAFNMAYSGQVNRTGPNR